MNNCADGAVGTPVPGREPGGLRGDRWRGPALRSLSACLDRVGVGWDTSQSPCASLPAGAQSRWSGMLLRQDCNQSLLGLERWQVRGRIFFF